MGSGWRTHLDVFVCHAVTQVASDGQVRQLQHPLEHQVHVQVRHVQAEPQQYEGSEFRLEHLFDKHNHEVQRTSTSRQLDVLTCHAGTPKHRDSTGTINVGAHLLLGQRPLAIKEVEHSLKSEACERHKKTARSVSSLCRYSSS